MFNLMYRGVPTTDINNMDYFEMREWNKNHELMNKATLNEMNKWKAQNGR